ncbi:unnamed protein product [Chrysodeixis includens]|uniref:Uncharacterized protein n=1 Tax=Chrysodeixis includens TaxID=689277 RepID=A0A9N8PZ29_CHRIL|nr:unnamed protein product [Chrysodeixis includens]
MMTRPLQSGDTFTPLEMLPIAVKLLAKGQLITYKNGPRSCSYRLLTKTQKVPDINNRGRRTGKVGISLLDEIVERIIEHHVLKVKPENMRGLEQIETLEEYFNNIIMSQHRKTTPAYDPGLLESDYPDESSTSTEYDDQRKKLPAKLEDVSLLKDQLKGSAGGGACGCPNRITGRSGGGGAGCAGGGRGRRPPATSHYNSIQIHQQLNNIHLASDRFEPEGGGKRVKDDEQKISFEISEHVLFRTTNPRAHGRLYL